MIKATTLDRAVKLFCVCLVVGFVVGFVVRLISAAG